MVGNNGKQQIADASAGQATWSIKQSASTSGKDSQGRRCLQANARYDAIIVVYWSYTEYITFAVRVYAMEQTST